MGFSRPIGSLVIGVTAVLLITLTSQNANAQLLVPWTYDCDEFSRCIRVAPYGAENATDVSEYACKLTCGDRALFWPFPTDIVKLDKTMANVNPTKVTWTNRAYYGRDLTATDMVQRNIDEQVKWLYANDVFSEFDNTTGASLELDISFSAGSSTPQIGHSTDESYTLDISQASGTDGLITAKITAPNYFGVRHAIETLFQTMEFDDLLKRFIMLNSVTVEDAPVFGHRGMSLDTSRNFMSKEVLMRLIDGLGASKMNVFHWHIVDTHSFPVEMQTPELELMHQYGAYSEDQLYTRTDIQEIIEYANYRGVRVIPELDQPAHVGAGWNQPGWDDYAVCVNREPWYNYCVEPPCGQLNPAKSEIYDILELIYAEWYDIFKFDTFHMGADEINFDCWNTTAAVTDWMVGEGGFDLSYDGFIAMWSQFQARSSERLLKAYGGAEALQIVVWTSKLTLPENIDELPSNQYIIQIWTDATDPAEPTIKQVAESGYKMIFSNVDASYMDCGFGAWVGTGNNWCSPYKGWQKQYENNPFKILEDKEVSNLEEAKSLVLGGEVAMWTEQTDDMSVEGKIFPRASSYGERLWSNPETGWYAAEPRMLHHRQRLVQRGVRADRLQPEYCRLNDGHCYGNDDDPNPPPPAPTTTTTEATATTETSSGVVASALFGLVVMAVCWLRQV